MNRRKPNLFIIGAMKSGTSSLHTYLNDHPDIFMCPRKEPSYFVEPKQLREIWPELERKKLWGNEERYLALFDGAREEKILGESSTAYTKLNKVTGVAKRIFDFNPEARLIYVMRDPIERTISHYWHSVAHDGEYRGLLKALRAEPHYTEVSDYALQLKPYLDLFGSDNVMAITMEQMLSEKRRVIADIFDWLGVHSTYVPGNLHQIKNVAPKEMEKASGLGLLYRLRNSQAWELIEGIVPKSAKRWATQRMTSKISKNTDETPAAIDYLRPILQYKVRDLETLLQRDFPEWKTLWG
ncbi:MAG: sulfotransferase [Gallionellaceae bacterium]